MTIENESKTVVKASNSPQVPSPQEASTQQGNGISRRKFLQILGSASAVGAVGCTDSATQNIFPSVKGDAEQIPGVATWFSSTCTECSAGCGIQVRTREGRAVKIEGNTDNPVNRGGLCALGQASLQHHYDPDRIRQPLKRITNDKGLSVLQPISWNAAYAEVATLIKNAPKKKALITGEVSGSLGELLKDWTEAFKVERAAYDLSSQNGVARAAELVYGTYGIPTYAFDKADVVVNFGADFLETWVSPCEYARGWAKSRRAATPARVVHIEPRLSLTGANADHWLCAAPGSELGIAQVLLKKLLDYGKGKDLSSETLQNIKETVAHVELRDVAVESGVSVEKILLTAEYLKSAKNSLVIAGGTTATSSNGLALQVTVNFINLVLGNVGTTVNLAKLRTPTSAPSKLVGLIESIDRGEVSLLLISDTNPAFTLPSGFGFGPELIKKVKTVVSFSSHLDETTELADLVLPSSSGLESWGDARPYVGVYNIIQPTMTTVFDTRSFGDSLLTIAKTLNAQASFVEGVEDYAGYVKAQWKKLHSVLSVSSDFNTFWAECVERGGYFTDKAEGEKSRGAVKAEAYTVISSAKAHHSSDEMVLYPYLSVKSFDGRAANRPWMQELPDPMTSIVWDSWAEMHPETAKARHIKQGDFVTIRNYFGEIDVPAFITEHVGRNVIAVPIGQGHSSYGRFAKKVGGGNVLGLVAKMSSKEIAAAGDFIPLLTPKVEVLRGRGKSEVVLTQGSDMQGKRELAKITFVGDKAAHTASHGDVHLADTHAKADGHEEHGAGHHEVKQMYKQREHPLYQWGMSVDLNTCTGCGACVVACYAENNIPVVGKKLMSQGREMSWLRIERYMDGAQSEELQVSFLPMMCQHCQNAPCEPVCPVFATYHNDEGLNVMVYNRCVGTRYCSNNCSYKVRRFNWVEIDVPEPLSWQLNPDVSKRVSGMMEKCTFCIQRISEGKDHAKDLGRLVKDGEIKPACVQSCATEAITFGNLLDPDSGVSKRAKQSRSYKVLDHHINTQPSVSYLERVKHRA